MFAVIHTKELAVPTNINLRLRLKVIIPFEQIFVEANE